MRKNELSSPMKNVNAIAEKNKKGYEKEQKAKSEKVKKNTETKSQLRDEVQMVEDTVTDWPDDVSSSQNITYSDLSDKRKRKKKKSKKKRTKGSAKSRG